MASNNSMATFVAWCEENGYEPHDVTSRKAFEDAHTAGRAKRKHERKQVTLLCLARNAEGEHLFKRATIDNIKSQKEHTAELYVWEAREAGYDSATCVIVAETVDPS